MSAALDPARRPLLVAMDYAHAETCARQLNLPPESWFFLTNDDPDPHDVPADAQVIYCGTMRQPHVLAIIAASGTRTDDALVLLADGSLVQL